MQELEEKKKKKKKKKNIKSSKETLAWVQREATFEYYAAKAWKKAQHVNW